VIALSAKHGLTDWLAWTTSLRGWAMALQGRPDEGAVQIQEGLAASGATGAEVFRPHFLALLADSYMETGCLDDGLNALTEALAITNEHEINNYNAEIHRLKGELLLRQRDSNAAEALRCFEHAIEIARTQGAKSWELRAKMSLARLLASHGRREEAGAMLGEIYNWFTEGLDTADLKDARRLLEELAK
jgi:predicted ATPase